MNSVFDVFSDDDEQPQAQIQLPKRKVGAAEKKSAKKSKINSLQEPVQVVEEHIESVERKYIVGQSLVPAEEEGEIMVLHNVKHQVALPKNMTYIPIQKHVPIVPQARVWPFQLDPFQRTSINAIERGESVLVAAHTSAGKTVVAEYAIALSLKRGQRVIYTSPIKALSNQKYRDLLAEFGDVGLMTGDVTINQNATCLVMTTEILRSMLYRGSEVMREVAWVVFDEIHYMRDAIRGVVWEETLILLPDKVRFVFLSATIPNAMQFAQWICQIKHQPCHVVYTDYRPTPLQHYLFPQSGDGIHLVVDEKSNFKEDNFQKAIGQLQDAPTNAPKGKGNKKWTKKEKGPSDLFKIIKLINLRNFHPVIVFSFSKRECEANALQLSKLDFNSADEKELVKSIYTNAVQSLGEDDRELPQILHLLPLLQRGIGIHHSGLLPILKEVIEILFQEGLIKVLFATETFSIGLNMPAKTVVFTSVRKFDGVEQRWLSGGEYIQMSGRAGRRGLDDRGIVILMIDQKMEPDVAKGMLKGVSDPLNSAFHLTYCMILNLSRVDGVTHEYMLSNSFHQFQNSAKIPELEKNIEIYRSRINALEIPDEELVGEYYQICQQLISYRADSRKVVTNPTFCLPFLQPGRLVSFTKNDANGKEVDFGYGVILNIHTMFTKSKSGDLSKVNAGPKHLIDALLHCEAGCTDADPIPCPPGERGIFIIVPLNFDSIQAVSTIRLVCPKEVKTGESRNKLGKSLVDVQQQFKAVGVPQLDPVKDMRISDTSFVKLAEKIQVLQERKVSHSIHSLMDRDERFDLYSVRMQMEKQISDARKIMDAAEAVLQLDELKCRLRLLRRLGYITENDVIEMKGRVACEISAGDELVLTEMMFNGVFNDLSVEQTAALLSCFTCGERDEKTPVKPELADSLRALRETAKRIATISNECKIVLDPKEYVETFRHELMEVVYAWSLGAKFSEICKMTDIFEGSMIRSMRRLDELIVQLITAAKAIGNVELEEKFTACSKSIKRDIVFANSLYL